MRGILFDLDDTLYPYEHFRLSGFGAVAHAIEAQDGVAALRAFSLLCRARTEAPGREFQMLAAALGLPDARIGEWTTVFRQHRPDIGLGPAVAGVLARLRRDGWRIGILTNGDPAVQRRKLAALEVLPLVDAHVCAEEIVAGGKPAPACFEAALTALGADADRSVFVGNDPVADIQGARAAGLLTVRLRTSACIGPLATDADLVVDRIDDILPVVSRLVPEELAHVA